MRRFSDFPPYRSASVAVWKNKSVLGVSGYGVDFSFVAPVGTADTVRLPNRFVLISAA